MKKAHIVKQTRRRQAMDPLSTSPSMGTARYLQLWKAVFGSVTVFANHYLCYIAMEDVSGVRAVGPLVLAQ